MALFIINPTTGCNAAADDYEQCRQTYYAKKEYELNQKTSVSQTQCDFSSYQNLIDQLSSSSEELLIENQNLKSQNENILIENQNLKAKYQTLSNTISNNQCAPSTANLFVDNIFSSQGLIVLMSIAIIGLGYLLYKKAKNNF